MGYGLGGFSSESYFCSFALIGHLKPLVRGRRSRGCGRWVAGLRRGLRDVAIDLDGLAEKLLFCGALEIWVEGHLRRFLLFRGPIAG